jgi:acetolactate synthase-1/2/3 large subunit
MPVMTGHQFFADALRAYGITHVFFVPSVMFPTMAKLEGTNVVRVTTHGEKAAAYMADGYARASRRPGICLAQNGGASNLAAGLRDAYMGCSPVIAITGGPDPSRYRHVYQEIEDFSQFDPTTKLNMKIDHVDRVPDCLRQAFRTATTGTPGPVHLQMRGRHGQVLDDEADLQLIVEERFLKYPAFRIEAPQEETRNAAGVLMEARRPVIVAGGGATASEAGPEIVALAEKLSIPVATSLNGKGVIPENHPLSLGVVGTYSRSCANQIVAEGDLVLFIGSNTGSQVTNNWKIPRTGTRVMQLNTNPEEIGRNYPAVAGLLGDAKVTLRRLIDAVAASNSRTEWIQRAQQRVSEWRKEVTPMLTSDAVPLRPERVCKEITEFLPPDGVLVADTGHAGIWTGTLVELRHSTQRYIRCAGSLGWGFPGSLGVKCALPDKPVLCFTGDAGFYYHMAELETAVRYRINVVVLVNNNRSMNQEQRLIHAAYGGDMQGRGREMWVYEDINIAKVAEAMGCVGIRVERPDELRPALERAFKTGRPTVLDVVTDINALYPRPWG